MPIHSPAFDLVASALVQSLEGLPPSLIAITGQYASGKTTLARYLAWYFNVSLIETDLFLVPGPPPSYRNEEIERIIAFRLAIPRPVIVDGAEVLDLFEQLGRTPNFLIKVIKLTPSQSCQLPSPTIATTIFGPCTTIEIAFQHCDG